MSGVRVFTASSWDNPAPGVWEAHTPAPTPGDPPPFEAAVWSTHPGGACHLWAFTVFEANTSWPPRLRRIGAGVASTLNEAQQRAEMIASQHRDGQPPDPVTGLAVGSYDGYSVVICDQCGTHEQLERILMTGRCTGDGDQCSSQSFDGYTLDELAEALIG